MEQGGPGSWVRSASRGDARAWAQLVDRYNPMVWSIARSFRLSAADAADVVQTTWLRLVEHLDRLRDPDQVGAWLATTARHECLGLLRRQGRQAIPSDVVEELVDLRPRPGDGLLERERDDIVWSALGRVSGRCGQLLRLLASDPPPSYQEVSAALEMPVGSIGPTRARCLDRLREVIASVTGPTNVVDLL